MVDVLKPKAVTPPSRGELLATSIDGANARVAQTICEAIRNNMQAIYANPAYYSAMQKAFDVPAAQADFAANTSVEGMDATQLMEALQIMKAIGLRYFPSRLAAIFPAKSPLAQMLAAVPAATVTFPQ